MFGLAPLSSTAIVALTSTSAPPPAPPLIPGIDPGKRFRAYRRFTKGRDHAPVRGLRRESALAMPPAASWVLVSIIG